jgi:cation diffusion facilitator CzcD-associated flavoprotein CzcO
MTAVRSSSPTVLVLGAGLSGVLAGIKLKEAGIDTFEILEMGDSVGGTWRDNTYPGLSCDVPAHAYDYSFEPDVRGRPRVARVLQVLRRQVRGDVARAV